MDKKAKHIEKYLTKEGLEAWKDVLKCYEPGYLDKKITKWNEFCMLQELPRENIEYAFNNFQPRDGDVLIVSFPKTGTTWMREIVRQMLFKEDEVAMDASKDFDPFVSYLEGGRPSKYKVIEELPLTRRYFGTHLPPELINMKRMMEKNVKMIFMLRNPKDTMLSFYNFISGMAHKRYRIDGEVQAATWNDHFDEVLKEGQQAYHLPQGEWYFDFIKRWMPHLDKDYFISVYYEDLVKQPKNELRKVASHIGVELNEEELSRITDAVHISTMSKLGEKPGMEEMSRAMYGLVSKGGVGKWKDKFTVAQSELVDKLYQENLGNTNIKFSYC